MLKNKRKILDKWIRRFIKFAVFGSLEDQKHGEVIIFKRKDSKESHVFLIDSLKFNHSKIKLEKAKKQNFILMVYQHTLIP